jgi:hypothetical protein
MKRAWKIELIGPQPHRAGGELPEVGHQPGVRVAGQAARAVGRGDDLLPVVRQIGLAQPPFQEGARVDAGRAVRLEEHQVAPCCPVRALEEVVEADLEQVSGAGVAGDVAAQFAVRLVGPHHHRQRVPAHQRSQPLLQRQVAGKHRLRLGGNGVDVRRVAFGLPAHVQAVGRARQFVQQGTGTGGAFGGHQRLQGFAPLRGLGRVFVGRIRGRCSVMRFMQ